MIVQFYNEDPPAVEIELLCCYVYCYLHAFYANKFVYKALRYILCILTASEEVSLIDN